MYVLHTVIHHIKITGFFNDHYLVHTYALNMEHFLEKNRWVIILQYLHVIYLYGSLSIGAV